MKHQRGSLWRSRWAAIGAAVAVTLGSGGVLVAHAVSSGASSFVAVTPCRLYDTRPAPNSTGGRSTPLGTAEVVTLTVRGTNGTCTIPSDAIGVSANVTTLDGTAQSFLTIFPADAAQPNASSNNWTAGQSATPNKVDSKLSADGKIKVFNAAGTVDIIVDVVGYYESSASASGTGPAGPAGPVGPVGPAGQAAVGGVDFAEGAGGVALNTSAETVVATVTVAAPSAGFVVVSATTNIRDVVGGVSTRCGISKAATFDSVRVSQSQIVSSANLSSLALVQGFTVPAGNTTFNLLCQQANAGTAPVIENPMIVATFSATRL